MTVSSQTVGGVNVWAFQGVVTDAEIKTAWAGLIVDGEYVINRSIYLAEFVDLTQVQGGYSVRLTIGVNNFLLHTGRDRSKTVFKQWHFRQTVGMTVPQRTQMVANWNGTTLTYPLTSGGLYDGLQMEGGVFEYAVEGNTGLPGDNRFLNEMAFLTLDGTQILSTAFTQQEMQPQVRGFTELKGLTFTRNFGFPQTSFVTSRIVVFRSNQNTQHPVQRPIRINNSASICYIDSTVRRNAQPVTTNLIDGFGSQTARLLVLNNHTDESWFGETRLNFNGKVVNWGVNNQFFGGILKRFRFVGAGDNGTVKVYDSRSTTEPQRSTFVSFNAKDFLDTGTTTQTDANGRVEIVAMGAQMLPNLTITRFTDQRFTYQQFGKRVTVTDLDVTAGGDNDLSAFAPVVLTDQEAIVRTQANINAATEITSFQDLLEELHVLAIGLSGESSYAGAFNGNLFNFTGGVLTTSFASVVVDPTAASKISFDPDTNALIIKASVITDTADVARWTNSGTITLAAGAEIEGVYSANGVTSKIVEIEASAGSSIYVGDNSTGVTKLFLTDVAAGTYRAYYEPGAVPAVLVARELYGFQRFAEVVTLVDGLNRFVPVDVEDVGIAETDLATVQAYTELETPSKFYDRTAAFRLSEQGIKLGQIVTRSGRALETGTFSHVVDKDAGVVYEVDGGVITTKATSYQPDDRYDTEILTPPATLTANSTEVITIAIEDANGDSQVSIDGGDGTFELYKVTTASATNDFASGTLLATVGNGIFRFLAAPGFDIVGVDTNSNIRRRTSMSKGIYTQAFFVGEQIQLAQAPQVVENGVKLDLLKVELEEIKGAGFASSKDSLIRIRKKAALAAALSA